MKKHVWVVLAAAVLVVPMAALAGPNLNQIPGDAKWAVYADVKAIAGSSIATGAMKLLTDEAAVVGLDKVAKAQECWKKVQAVSDITLYGKDYASKLGVVIFNGKYKKEEVMKMAGIDRASIPLKYREKFEIFTFKAREGPQKGKEQFGCFVSGTQIIAAGSAELLKDALNLVGTEGKGLSAKSGLGLLLHPSEGSFVVAAGLDIAQAAAERAKAPWTGEHKGPWAGEHKAPWGGEHKGASCEAGEHGRHGMHMHPGGAFFRKVDSARLEIGEKGGNLFGSVKLVMKTEQDATLVSQIITGLKALGVLRGEEHHGDLAKLANAVTVKADGATVTTGIAWPVADILAKAKAKIEAKAAAAKK